MTLITLTDLTTKNIHIGHNIEFLNPKTKKFIYTIINKKCIIDLIKTAEYLAKAYSYFYIAGYTKQNILFIGSKSQSLLLIKNIAKITGNFYCNCSWIPGTLTNWTMIKSRLMLLEWIYTLIHNSEFRSKLSPNMYSKLYKTYKSLHFKFKGLIGLNSVPEIIFILDPIYEKIALQEAKNLNKIIVSILDVNTNPDNILIPIPGNDQNYNSVQFILKILAVGYIHGTSSN